MLARALRVGLFGTVVFAAWCAWWFAARQDAGWFAVLAVFAAAFLALPVTLTLASFAVAGLYRSPAPPDARVGPLGYARCVLVETFWFIALYWLVQAFPRRLLPGEAEPQSAGGPAVLLVHGFTCNAGVWVWFARELRRRGHAVFTLTLEPVYGPIDGYAAAVADRVGQISAGGRAVAIVGHSMGGLVARAYLRRYGGERVSALVTLGSPHHGTALAPLALGRNAFQMRRGSAWLAALEASEAGSHPVPVTSVYSCHDNIVAPQASSALADAANVALGGMGHMSLLFSTRTAAIVDEALRAQR
jgi:pimeloyl-ACP methyl ester carboxylesterase